MQFQSLEFASSWLSEILIYEFTRLIYKGNHLMQPLLICHQLQIYIFLNVSNIIKHV